MSSSNQIPPTSLGVSLSLCMLVYRSTVYLISTKGGDHEFRYHTQKKKKKKILILVSSDDLAVEWHILRLKVLCSNFTNTGRCESATPSFPHICVLCETKYGLSLLQKKRVWFTSLKSCIVSISFLNSATSLFAADYVISRSLLSLFFCQFNRLVYKR